MVNYKRDRITLLEDKVDLDLDRRVCRFSGDRMDRLLDRLRWGGRRRLVRFNFPTRTPSRRRRLPPLRR